jgi:hypothetical protein
MRCRLSCWLTNSSLVYEPKCGGGGVRVSANQYSCAHGAQINFGVLTPYLAYANDEKDEVYQMMDSSKAVPYRLAEPRASKPDIESTVNTSCGACPADLQL